MTKSKVKLWDRDRLVKVRNTSEFTTWIHPSAIGGVDVEDGYLNILSSTGKTIVSSVTMTIDELDAEINRSMEAIVEAESQLRQEMSENVKESLEKLLKEVNEESDDLSFGPIDKIGKDVN